MDNNREPAELEYLDGRFDWIRPGGYVICALTGEHIGVEQLRYWSVERQEPYASASVALERAASLQK